jgi:hypothetical protein
MNAESVKCQATAQQEESRAGRSMKKASEYRKHAAECRALAKRM